MMIDIASALFIFALVWWTVIFAVLPFGNAPAENPEAGHERGAPANPRIAKKMIWTTVLAVIVTGVIVWLIHYTEFSFFRSVNAAEPQSLTTQQLCQELVPYQPSDDVTYQPEVDVYGREVVPADVSNSNPVEITPDMVTLLITADQAAQLGLGGTLPYRPEAFVGQVTLDQDGNVYFNNRRIAEPQIQALCKDAM